MVQPRAGRMSIQVVCKRYNPSRTDIVFVPAVEVYRVRIVAGQVAAVVVLFTAERVEHILSHRFFKSSRAAVTALRMPIEVNRVALFTVKPTRMPAHFLRGRRWIRLRSCAEALRFRLFRRGDKFLDEFREPRSNLHLLQDRMMLEELQHSLLAW